jgi:L-ribulose-5-phosphate 3-epimerase
MNRRAFMGAGISAAAVGIAASNLMGAEGQQPKTEKRFRKTLKFGMVTKKGANGEDLSVEQRLQIAKDAGFESVEPDTIFESAAVAEYKAASVKVGMPIDGIICSTHWSHPLSDPDTKIVDHCMNGMRVSLLNAKDLGGTMVLLVPAVVKPGVRYSEAWERSVPRVKELAKDAEKLDIVIGIENVWNKFLLSPLEAKRYIEEIDSEYVKFWFDTGNVLLFGYPQDWIRTLGPLIARMDVKDFKTDTKEFVPLREGSTDWPEVRRAMDEIKYSGYLAAEVQGGDLAYLTDKVSKPMDLIIEGK